MSGCRLRARNKDLFFCLVEHFSLSATGHLRKAFPLTLRGD